MYVRCVSSKKNQTISSPLLCPRLLDGASQSLYVFRKQQDMHTWLNCSAQLQEARVTLDEAHEVASRPASSQEKLKAEATVRKLREVVKTNEESLEVRGAG